MIMSYGAKHGHPNRMDHTFDVRTLTHNTSSPEFTEKFREIVEVGRQNPAASIAIGCEQGKHRSVALANKVASALRVSVYHRDLSR